MSYEPTTWKSGDVVTSSKLNKMEQGIANAGGAFIVGVNSGTLDKTWKEINDALAGAVVLIVEGDGYGGHTSSYVISAFDDEGDYAVVADTKPTATTYTTDSENGYPSSEGPK